MQEYSFSFNSSLARRGISDALIEFFGGEIPVVICIGTDASIGDSFGPIVGTKLIELSDAPFVYGSLSSLVTAKDVLATKNFVASVHPSAKLLVIDAAVGKDTDVGIIRVGAHGVKPGLGADKDLPMLGDTSIIAIVAPKNEANKSFLKLTRLAHVYRYAEVVALGIKDYLDYVAMPSVLSTLKDQNS